MSWLSNAVNSAAGWGGEDPVAVQQRQQAAAQAAAAAEAEAQRQQQAAAALAAAQASNANVNAASSAPTEADTAAYRQDALARLNALLPMGFESSLVSNKLGDPFEEKALGASRSKGEELLNNLFSRGTLTDVGKTRGLAALDTQTPKLRTSLDDISKVLLEQERGRQRGIGNTARDTIAGLQVGQAFDPETYRGQSQQSLGKFTAGLPGAFEAATAKSFPGGDLYDLAGLPGAAGAVQGGSTVNFDPFAVAGGQITPESSGVASEAAPPPEGGKKKRTTAVF